MLCLMELFYVAVQGMRGNFNKFVRGQFCVPVLHLMLYIEDVKCYISKDAYLKVVCCHLYDMGQAWHNSILNA